MKSSIKRILCLLIAAFASTTMFAQTTTITTTTSSPKASLNPGGVYLKGGLNIANISTNSDGTVSDANNLSSFHVGFIADVPLASVLSFQTGLMLTGKGAKTDIYYGTTTDDNYYKLKTNPLYIELPANLVIKIPMGSDARLFVGAGPYIAMGIGGKTTGQRKALGVTSDYSQDIQFNDDDPTTSEQEDASVNKLRRFDYGINALAGIEVQRFMIGVNYGWGLSKISSADNSNDNDKNKFRTLSVSLGIRL
jgi:hypothetical protein